MRPYFLGHLTLLNRKIDTPYIWVLFRYLIIESYYKNSRVLSEVSKVEFERFNVKVL